MSEVSSFHRAMSRPEALSGNKEELMVGTRGGETSQSANTATDTDIIIAIAAVVAIDGEMNERCQGMTMRSGHDHEIDTGVGAETRTDAMIDGVERARAGSGDSTESVAGVLAGIGIGADLQTDGEVADRHLNDAK